MKDLKLTSLNNEDNNTTTAERYLISGKSDYRLSDISYLFGTVDYEDDRFSGYDYRATEVVGYGRRVLNTETMTLELEAGEARVAGEERRRGHRRSDVRLATEGDDVEDAFTHWGQTLLDGV